MQFVLPLAVRARRALTAIRIFGSSVRLLRAVVCCAAGDACWVVPADGDGRFGHPARAGFAGCALGDVGRAIAHGRCAAPSGDYEMRAGHIRVTQFITNPRGQVCWRPRRSDNGSWPC